MKYFDELKKAMEMLAEEKNTIFLGQAVDVPGTAMYNTLRDIDSAKKIEFPVAENMQLGASIGLSIQGFLPISIFPRWNFLLSATDQLVHHLDKYEEISDGEFKPKVIIRVGVGSEQPLYPGKQHIGDFTEQFIEMCSNIAFIRLEDPESILPAYKNALNDDFSTVLVEYSDYYNSK